MTETLSLEAERELNEDLARWKVENSVIGGGTLLDRLFIAGWMARNRRASPAAAVPEGALPPLPAPWQDRSWSEQPPAELDPEDHTKQLLAEIADWRAFGAAVEADRAQRPRVTPEMFDGLHASLKVLEDAQAAREAQMARLGLADRAQQGEPVADDAELVIGHIEQSRAVAADFCPIETRVIWAIPHPNLKTLPNGAEVFVRRAATKAAPADAPTVERAARALIAAFDDPTCHIASLNNYVRDLDKALSGAAPVPDTGIPTAGEVLRKLVESGAGRAVLERLAQGMHTETDDGKAWLAAKAIVEGAPVSTTPTPGEVEWTERELRVNLFAVRRFINHAYAAADDAAQDKRHKKDTAGKLLADAKDAEIIAGKLARMLAAAAPHPSEAKAGEQK